MRKKIVFVSHEATRTGAPILLLNILRHLREQLSYDFVVVLGKDGPIRPQFEQVAQVVTYPALLASGHFAGGLQRLGVLDRYNKSQYQKAFAFKDVEVIFSNTIVNGELVDKIRSVCQARVITYVHELAYIIQTFDPAIIQKTLQQTSLFLAGSTAVQRQLISMNVAPERVQVVPSSIPVASIAEDLAAIETDSVRFALKLAVHEQLVVAVGTADWRKGNDLFMQMAAQVALNQPHVHFAWVGVSPGTIEHLRMSYEIQHYKLEGRFHLVPVTSEYLKYIASADVFVLPSREDPFPLVVLEAAAAGKPVVCFAEAGGTPDFVGTTNGEVVPYGDITAMSSAVATLLSNHSTRQQKGANARATVQQDYNTPQVAARIARLMTLPVSW
ncbi:glycosyltransferase family 4 protein [Hymenobacter bucti]|uniref:Glycosyltransferase family 4 protein n=1 Tax=Hymenobacter bucti TaxID=1844114 RepID=A0ABW4QT83_9BACT